MQARDREKESRDSVLVILLILLLGFICIILASGWAIRFMPSWRLPASMGSSLNPNSDFLTSQPLGLLQPLDPAILTNPAWFDVFLTPGATFNTRTPRPTATPTIPPPPTGTTPTRAPTASPTVSLPTLPANTATRTTVPGPGGPTSTRTATGVVAATSTATPTATRTATATSTATATFTATATSTFTATATPTATPTNTSVLQADLQITKTDSATAYEGGSSIQYTIVVTNNGPNNVMNATVTDVFSTNLDPSTITWICTAPGGASCTPSGTGNINDTAVQLPPGSSLTYTVNATAISSPIGNLDNTASVSPPIGVTDPIPGNNSAADTDLLIVPDQTPPEIGPSPDPLIYYLPSGTYLTLQLGTPLVLDGNTNPTEWDLIYYELPQGVNPGIFMDAVILQISDGRNWYTVLDWGNGSADSNTIIPIPLAVPPNPTDCSGEPDNCEIDASLLFNSTGVAINADAAAPAGTYRYIRIFAPSAPPDTDGMVEVDAITVLP